MRCGECRYFQSDHGPCGVGIFTESDSDCCTYFLSKSGVVESVRVYKQPVKVFENNTYNKMSSYFDELKRKLDMRKNFRKEFDREPVVEPNPRYVVSVNYKAWAKMFFYTQYAKGEVSGYFKTRRVDNFELVVTDILIMEQECTGAHTEISEGDMANFLIFLERHNEKIEDWNGWWHSHGNMGVGWSGEDRENIESHSDAELLVSLLTNKDSELIARIDVFKPVRVCYQPLVRILPTGYDRLGKKCRKQVARLVKEKPFTLVTTSALAMLGGTKNERPEIPTSVGYCDTEYL